MNGIFLFIFAFLFLIGVLVVIHEFGHFWVARLCGVKVLRFSLGLGPVLWKRRFGKDQTEWAFCALPFGGYVSMLDEREGEVDPKEACRAFNRQSVGRRSAIVLAGPLANFVLAILVYWAIFFMGTMEIQPVLGSPAADTPAARAGIAAKDLVQKVGAVPVATWGDFRWQFLRQAAESAHVELEVAPYAPPAPNQQGIEGQVPSNNINTRLVSIETGVLPEKKWEGDVFADLGLRHYMQTLPVPARIGDVLPDMPASMAGIKKGDQVLEANGRPVKFWFEMQDIIAASATKPVALTLARQGETLRLNVTPQEKQLENGGSIGLIGVRPDDAHEIEGVPEMSVLVRHGFLDSALLAFKKTWETSAFSLKMMGKLFTGEVSWRMLSGPVTIAQYAGKTAQVGLEPYFTFLALVSISLGILNLLPIPVLDGGHLLYYCLEVIKGSPVSERAMTRGIQIGMALLVVLMVFALFNDLSRLFGSSFAG